MIVSLAYVTIETVDPEPALATGEFDCVDSKGRAYVYQSTWSGNTLTINRGINNDSGTFVREFSYDTFSSWSSTSNSNISEVNSLAITTDGEMFALLKQNNSAVKFYKLNYDGTAQHISSVSVPNGDNNAASNYEVDVGGTTYKYYITSKGFFNGNVQVIRIDGDGTYHIFEPQIDNGGNGSNKAKDFAWVSNHPSGNDFVGYDSNANDLLGAEITSHTGHGTDSEAMTINLSVLNGNIASGIGSNSGAAMSLGNGDVYFLENTGTDGGSLWLYDESAGTITESGNSFASSSNTDGAGCGIGLQENDEFSPDITLTNNASCTGSERKVNVVLNNTSSDISATFINVTYSGDGHSGTVTSSTTVSASSNSSTFTTTASFSDGTTVTVSWYAENTTYGLRSPSSNTSSKTISVDASACSSGPNAVTLIDSQSLGACLSGSKTSTLSLQNSSGSTAYVTVEYSTNSGSTWTVHTDAEEADNLTITNGQTNTSLTASVPNGSSIEWRYKSSDTSGDWSGLSYVTASDMNSSTVSCPQPPGTSSISQSLGACSGGSKTSTLSIVNGDGSTRYFKVEYKIDSGSYTTVNANFSLAASTTAVSYTHLRAHET